MQVCRCTCGAPKDTHGLRIIIATGSGVLAIEPQILLWLASQIELAQETAKVLGVACLQDFATLVIAKTLYVSAVRHSLIFIYIVFHSKYIPS